MCLGCVYCMLRGDCFFVCLDQRFVCVGVCESTSVWARLCDGSVSLTLILEAPQWTISQGWLALAVTHIQWHTHTRAHTHRFYLGSVYLVLIWLSELLPFYTPNTCTHTHTHKDVLGVADTHMPTAGHIRSLGVWLFPLPQRLLSPPLLAVSPAPGLYPLSALIQGNNEKYGNVFCQTLCD